MTRSLIFLSGFSFGAAVHNGIDGNWELAMVAVFFSGWLIFAYRMLRPDSHPQATSGAATAIQPKPKGTGPDIADLVCQDIMARKVEGTKKYGEPLRPFNGRSALVDAYQEALDLAQYLRQAIEEDQRSTPENPRP